MSDSFSRGGGKDRKLKRGWRVAKVGGMMGEGRNRNVINARRFS